jgi:2-polyprenyl-3-methyl-5-hydroxy-6-metoxy-1,4-benzoquinol methylase
MPVRGEEYDARFAQLEAEGRYLHGEADLVDWLLGPGGGRVLDAGCGTGRLAVELARRGREVVGVDRDPVMLDVARAKAPTLTWVLADLSDPEVASAAGSRRYDLAVAAGNVMIFVVPGTESAVVRNLATMLVPGGLLVAGFQLGGSLSLEHYDTITADATLELVHRWATWERDRYTGGDYAVSVHRRGVDR